MAKHIVFDFDGTMVNSKSAFIQAFNEVAAKYNLRELKEEEINLASAKTIIGGYRMIGVPFYKIPIMLLRLPRLIKEVQQKLQKHIGSLHAVNGIKDTILSLKEEGFKLDIISTNSVSNIEQFLKSNGLQVFNNVYSSRGLSDKYITINRFIKKSHISKEDMVYIGDELRDIKACKKSGVKIISVAWGYNSTELLEKGEPDFIINSPSEIIGIAHNI